MNGTYRDDENNVVGFNSQCAKATRADRVLIMKLSWEDLMEIVTTMATIVGY